jgi:hypothetical protein
MRRLAPYVLTALLAACGGAPADAPVPPGAEAPPAATTWRTNPAEGVVVQEAPVLSLGTGPHTIGWRQDDPALEPPYAVSATFHKQRGRLHEAYGLLFGGRRLDAAEGEQTYSYFLVRGDGSFLIKRRVGPETPVVRDWTRHPAVLRDGDDGGRPNTLEVRAHRDETAFLVNGQEVARVPSDDLDVRGRAGVRVSHEVQVDVRDYRAAPGGDEAPGAP